MENKQTNSIQQGTVPAIIAFVGIVLVIAVIALLNAPTMGGARVMASPQTYFTEVRATALPFMAVVTVLAMIAGYFIAREVKKVWSHTRKRKEFLTGYAFLAPYLIVTLTFTVGVILFALYISFNKYDIFTRPEWIGLGNYKEAFAGFTDSTKRDFLQALYNVLWYAAIVVPVQTILARRMALLLNAPIKLKQFFRTVFYAPSVTSSVVITLIFIWLYLKNGYLNFFIQTILGWVGIDFTPIAWLGDPRGLIQLIVEAFGGKIPRLNGTSAVPASPGWQLCSEHLHHGSYLHDHVPGCAAGYQSGAL